MNMTMRFLRSNVMFNVDILKNKKVIVFGCGGVGGYVIESLARTGIGNIDIYDYDVVDVTNINRQIIALDSTVGLKKVDVFKKRLLDINPYINVRAFDMKITLDNIDEIDLKADYVIDCIDMITSKIAIIKRCKNESINIISATSAGGKMNISDLRIAKLNQTINCPICRILRNNLKGIDLDVCYSTELGMKKGEFIPSNSLVPPAMGLKISEFVLKKLVK